MTLLITGQFRIDPARRDDFIAAASVMQQASSAEEGCSYYIFSADLYDESCFHLSEKWSGQEALDAHFAMPHMAVFGQALAGVVTGTDVLKYEVASEGPIR